MKKFFRRERVSGDRLDFAISDIFMNDLAGGLNNRVQLTTDGHLAYSIVVERAFDNDFDYTQLGAVQY